MTARTISEFRFFFFLGAQAEGNNNDFGSRTHEKRAPIEQ